jgi:tetratricopeptide (TPR) repeat protein/transcriptional regulator with XRE-family HTH domain
MATSDTLAFGDLLRRYRVLAGLTQEALAERAHLSTRAISALEQGINRTPRTATLALLAEALELSAEAHAALAAAAQQDTRVGQQAPAGRAAARSSSPPLVGRAQELSLLAAHLAGVGPPLLLLAGEPGMGKSRLLQHAAAQAPAAGWMVLAGGCQRRGGQEPYAPLLQALTEALQGRTRAELRALLRGCAWLVRLLPELAGGPIEPLPPWTVSPEQERRLMVGAIERFLANVAGPAGTLLVLDDLQWAGPDALDLLTTLARAGAARLRVVGAYRDTEVQSADPLSSTLSDLAQAGLVRHQVLPPLALMEVRQLLDALLDGSPGDCATLAARVAQRTGGVPFFVVSCAQALRGEREDAEAIPWDVAQGIRQRAAALSAVACEALGVAAIAVGRRVQAPLLAAVLQQPEHRMLEALEEAWRVRLLIDVDGGYRIAHDLIREVLEADLSPGRRALLHRRTAEALEGRPGAASAEVLAYHYGHSDAPERAVRYLEQAGDQALAQHGRAAAEGYYRAAVAQLDGLGRSLDAARVSEKLGALLHTCARYAEALASLERAAEAHRVAGDLEATGRVVAVIAQVHIDGGTPAEGLVRLEPVLAMLEGRGPSPALAALYAAHSDLFYMLGRLHESLAAAAEAERIARLVGDDYQLAYALACRGVALLMLGQSAEAIRALSAATVVAEAAGAPFMMASSSWPLSSAHLELGSFALARDAAERVLQLAERHGFPSWAALGLVRRGSSAFLAGEWATARKDFEQAIAIGRGIGPFWGSFFAPLSLGLLCLAEGSVSEASEHLQECEQLLHSGRHVPGRLRITCALAERDLRAGHPEQAQARLATLLAPDTPQEEDATALHLLMAWALHDLGELDEAAEVAARAVARARETGRLVLLVDALRVAALVAVRQRCWGEVEGACREGLSLARRLGYPYGEARLLHLSGALCAQIGQPEAAREHLDAALALFRGLGARRDSLLVEQLLATLSQSPLVLQKVTTRSVTRRVTAAQWAAIAALLPPPIPTGRPRADDRQTLEAILHKLETGCAWRSIPAELGDGVTAYRRLRAWHAAGLWEQIQAIVQDPSL